jgi:hypothetical protein
MPFPMAKLSIEWPMCGKLSQFQGRFYVKSPYITPVRHFPIYGKFTSGLFF